MFKNRIKVIFFLIILLCLIVFIIYKKTDFGKYNRFDIAPSQYTNNRIITIPKSIWRHGVNSRKDLKHNINKYDGFEIDINFNIDKRYFNVSCDYIEGNENLNNMLRNIKDLNNRYLWLDFKNLSNENKEFALSELNEIVEKNNLKKEHIIVESSMPICLNIFKKAGFYTSFYLNCYAYDNVDELPKLLLQDIKKLERSEVDFVSSDAYYFDIVINYFPNIAHLFWTGELTKNKIDYFFKDKNTYVILKD